MSREERRNYERMMKNMDRGPALPPAARARAERKAAKRSQRTPARPGAFTTRFWIRTVLIAVALGFLAFSLQWPNMPFAAYVGLGVGAVVLAVLLAVQVLGRRRAPPAT